MIKKMIVSGMVVLGIMAGVLTGCTDGAGNKELHLAIVNGNCANSAHINTSKAQDYINKACKSYGDVSVIVADGKPYQSAEIDIPDQRKSGLSDNKLNKVILSQTEQIMGLLEDSKAKTEEVDLLSSINSAARFLNSAEGGIKEMLILHSGLSTTGILDFTNGNLGSSEIPDVLEYLKKEQAIPDLKGTHITWTGLCDTKTPQPELSSKNKAYLQELWKSILETAGAEVDFAQDLPTETEQDETLPKVSIVNVLQPASAIKEVIDNEKIEETAVVLDEEVVNFKPGSAVLVSSEKNVKKVLKEYIKYMSENPSYKVLFAGTTASAGKQDELVVLSEQRCNTIKKIFIQSGVKEDQIETIGLGYKNNYYIKDTDKNGNLIEEKAKKNRSVIILPLDSDDAEALLAGR